MYAFESPGLHNFIIISIVLLFLKYFPDKVKLRILLKLLPLFSCGRSFVQNQHRSNQMNIAEGRC